MFGEIPLWLAIFSDVGVSLLAIINSMSITRIFRKKDKEIIKNFKPEHYRVGMQISEERVQNVSLEKFIPISYDPATHGYYKVSGRVGNAFQDGNKLK